MNKKGISPVIATVVIVAIAIAVAIAVAYWVRGLVPAFTRHEVLKVTCCYVNDETTAKIVATNTGNSDATISNVLVNGRLPVVAMNEVTVMPGESVEITIHAVNYEVGTFQNGIVYDFTIHTVTGGSYPTSVRVS